MGREQMQARLKELETEKSVLEWALEASLHEKDVDSDDEDSKSGYLSTYTMADYPASDAEGHAAPAQIYLAGSITDTESSASLHSAKQSVYSDTSTMARIQFSPTMQVPQVIHSDPASYCYDGTGMSEDGCEDEETIRGSTTCKGKEKEVSENNNATDPNSPLNVTNPHPTLSISTKFLQKAIFDSRKPGTPFVRSIIHRDRVDGKEITFKWPESVFGCDYTEWKWIPFLVFGPAAQLVSTNIAEGDIEIICMKDTHFTSMIQNNKDMFEEPGSVAAKSVLHDELKPVFNGPESWGFRVLVWRLHSSKKTFYMDREGHPIPGRAGTLPWDEAEAKN
ncbi:hypothetical protein HZ326_24344 [Fusarium oxysporum f. sp. albedinis]|nr:hypothetical protein HZ326_24344 [Fusarium oxysporum f. sp. albedinis]KAK2473020.1 hypothetical protein H9L39_15195 [Fusarium oxysporum f. sp. albedinis]